MAATNQNVAIRFLWVMNAPHLIGQLLREQRAKRDLTEAAAAHDAGISVRNLQRIEKGEFTQMRKLTRTKLAAFYKLDPEDLRAPVEEPVDEEELREQLQDVLSRLQRIEDAVGALVPSQATEPRAAGDHPKPGGALGRELAADPPSAPDQAPASNRPARGRRRGSA